MYVLSMFDSCGIHGFAHALLRRARCFFFSLPPSRFGCVCAELCCCDGFFEGDYGGSSRVQKKKKLTIWAAGFRRQLHFCAAPPLLDDGAGLLLLLLFFFFFLQGDVVAPSAVGEISTKATGKFARPPWFCVSMYALHTYLDRLCICMYSRSRMICFFCGLGIPA